MDKINLPEIGMGCNWESKAGYYEGSACMDFGKTREESAADKFCQSLLYIESVLALTMSYIHSSIFLFNKKEVYLGFCKFSLLLRICSKLQRTS